MLKHDGPISGVATYTDKFVATAGYDNRIILWNAKTGFPVARGFHDHLANHCQFSQCGQYLLSASSDYSARLWEVPTLRLKTVYGEHLDDVEMAIFIDDGKRIATASRDHALRIFHLDGQLQHTLEAHAADVISVVWEPAGRRILSSSDDGTLRRWDTDQGKLIETIDLDEVETDTVAITGNGTIFAGNDKGEIICVSPTSRRVRAHEAGIKRLVYSADADLVVSMSYDRQAAFWKANAEGELHEIRRTAIPSIVWPRSCAFLGKNRLVAASFGSTYATFDLDSGEWNETRIEPTTGFNAVRVVGDFTYSVGDAGVVYRDGEALANMGSLCNFLLPLGGLILTGGQMGQVLDGSNGRILYQHRSPLNCGATFQRNGVEHAIIGTYTGEGLVFRAEADALVSVATIALNDNAIKGIACSHDSIFAVCANASLSWHATDDFRLLGRVEHAHDRIINGCATIDNDTFASISRDLTLKIWHNRAPSTYSSPHRNSIKCIAASNDGRWIGTGSYGGSLAIFDVRNRTWAKFVRPSASGISCIATGRCNGEFVATSYDGRIHTIAVDDHVAA
jgi:toxoflavin biosynthesis protein ToxC